jgi:hypothetical protein
MGSSAIKKLSGVAIFATFGRPVCNKVQKTLPNQGLGRKIARDLLSFPGEAGGLPAPGTSRGHREAALHDDKQDGG